MAVISLTHSFMGMGERVQCRVYAQMLRTALEGCHRPCKGSE